MVTIRILDYVNQAYNNDDGQVIHDILLQHMKQGGGSMSFQYTHSDPQPNEITLSFQGIDSVPSSFVNSALIQLLESFSFDKIKSTIRFSSTNQQINEMIRSRFLFEVERKRKRKEKDVIAAH